MGARKLMQRLLHPHRGLLQVEIDDSVKHHARSRISQLYHRLEVLDAEVRLEDARQQRRNHTETDH